MNYCYFSIGDMQGILRREKWGLTYWRGNGGAPQFHVSSSFVLRDMSACTAISHNYQRILPYDLGLIPAKYCE
jgi:hypothetical protein